jgi:hypothetical protein
VADVGVGFVDILPRSTAFFGSLKGQIDSQLGAVEASTASRSAALLHGVGTAVIAVGAAFAVGIGKAVATTVEWGTQVRQLQLLTGQTAEQASGLLAAAGTYGIGVDKLATSLGFLEKNLVANTPAVAKWGVTARDAAGNLLPVDEILGNVADKFVELGGPGGLGTAFIKTLGGRGGQSLIPLLAGGAAGLQEMEDHAKALGLVMSQDDVDAAKNLAIAQRQLGESVKGAAIAIGTDFIPVAKFMVDALASMFQWVSRLPKPLLDLAIGIPVVAGAITLLVRAGKFLVEGFSTIFGALAGTGAAETAAIAPTVALTEAIQGLVEVLGVEVPAAADTADASLAGFAATESGLLLPTGAAAGGIEAETVAVGGLAAGLTTLGAVLVGAGSAYALWKQTVSSGSQLAVGAGAIGSGAAASGGTGPALTSEESNRILQAQIADINNANSAYQDYYTHLDHVAKSQGMVNIRMQASVALLDRIRQAFNDQAAQNDPTAPMSQAGLDALGSALDKTSGQMDKFTQVSGVDGSQIITTLRSVVDNVKSTPAQILAAYQTAVSSSKALWTQWHDQIASSLNQTGNDLQKFSGQATIDPQKLKASLQQSIQDTRAFGSDIQKIASSGVKGIGDQTQALIALGPQYAAAMVRADGTVRKNLVETFVRSENAANSSASGIEKALAPVFDKMLLALRNVVRAIQGLPPVHIDTGQAQAALDALIAKAAQLKNALYSDPHSGPHPPPRGHPVDPYALGVQPPPAIPLSPPASPVNGGGRHGRVTGQLQITDWRNGIASLDAELSHEYATSGW